MDNSYNQWQADGDKVVSHVGLPIATAEGPSQAAWIAERLNYASVAQDQLAAFGTSRLITEPEAKRALRLSDDPIKSIKP